MPVSPSGSTGRGVQGTHHVARPVTAGSAVRRTLRHRLVLVTPTSAEAVRHAGGWLFDRSMAGWEVIVLRADHADARALQALRILGARAASLEPVLASPVRGPWPQSIAVHAELHRSDPRVRRIVQDALGDGSAEVRFWGDRCPADASDGPAVELTHRLSLAARAFKAQALAMATGPGGPVRPVGAQDVTEVFHGAVPQPVRLPAPRPEPLPLGAGLRPPQRTGR